MVNRGTMLVSPSGHGQGQTILMSLIRSAASRACAQATSAMVTNKRSQPRLQNLVVITSAVSVRPNSLRGSLRSPSNSSNQNRTQKAEGGSGRLRDRADVEEG